MLGPGGRQCTVYRLIKPDSRVASTEVLGRSQHDYDFGMESHATTSAATDTRRPKALTIKVARIHA